MENTKFCMGFGDTNVGTNSNETDLVLNFIKVEEFDQDVEEVFWCTYC
ncbi:MULTISPECIES: hypothetical protein [Paenibacillus]|uniref:Uncharacterized protein n=1 Tax=Paenibacillus vini TaxID=1476024 RepID=A0ABQ4MJB5_9BACL|nr:MULTISPECIES: hypothetical protein [Paenibacillus]MBQ4897895.1 hypothetical protein [Paenibacillus sp. Marseille-P2973]GIP56019.1 hypothetical protein J42TS3_50540 [Paenibacillus vini]